MCLAFRWLRPRTRQAVKQLLTNLRDSSCRHGGKKASIPHSSLAVIVASTTPSV